MSKFTVNATTLRALERALLGLAVELDDGGIVADKYGIQNTTDSSGASHTNFGRLNSADEFLYDFFTAWQNALGIIGTNIEVLAKQLGEAATTYEQNEQALQQLLVDPLLHPNQVPKVSNTPPYPLSIILGPNGTGTNSGTGTKPR